MAIGPIKYLADAPDPMEQALKGIQLVSSLRNIKAQNDAQAASTQAANQAQAAKEQYKLDLDNAFTEGTPQAFAKLSSLYPGQAKAFEQSLSMLNEDQKQKEIAITGQVYSALSSGNPAMAKDILSKRINAMKEAGENTEKLESFSGMMEKDPKNAKNISAMFLSSVMGPDKFMATYKGLGEVERVKELHPLEVEKLKEEVVAAPEKRRLRAMEAQLQKETNELRREELRLKIDTAKKQQDIKVADRVNQAESAVATMDSTIDSATRILSHPGLEMATGKSSFMSFIPGTEAREFTGLVETLKSQAFLSGIEKMKGMGALSEAEGRKISSAIANLDLGQSAGAFKRNLNIALDTFKSGREKTIKKYGDVLKKPEEEVTEQTTETTTVSPTTQTTTTKSYLKYGKAQ